MATHRAAAAPLQEDGDTQAARTAAPGLLHAGSGEPLVLLHGITGSASMWKRVLPLLTPHHEVFALTAVGHRGGSRAEIRPVRIEHVVDDAERSLDRLGLERAHVAGNSLGGWVALELARRGRARSVCALSPAGAWTQDEDHGASTLRRIVRRTRKLRPMLPILAHWPRFRRKALRDNAHHGERVSPAEFLELADDLLGCTACEELFESPEQLVPLAAPCPITIAWSRFDRIFPIEIYAARARALVPDARHIALEDVGHVPMLDDPELVASTILASTQAA